MIADSDVADAVFETVFNICLEIAKEGREGKQVGTAFVIGDTENVLSKSRQAILNPFAGHRIEDRMITSYDIRENIKEWQTLTVLFCHPG